MFLLKQQTLKSNCNFLRKWVSLRGLSLFIGMGGFNFTRRGHHFFLFPIGGSCFFLYSIGGCHHCFFFWWFNKIQNKRPVYPTIQNVSHGGSTFFSSFNRGGRLFFQIFRKNVTPMPINYDSGHFVSIIGGLKISSCTQTGIQAIEIIKNSFINYQEEDYQPTLPLQSSITF